MSSSTVASVLAALLFVLSLVSFTSAQNGGPADPFCTETFLDLYSVTVPTDPQVGAFIFNISTQPGTDTYNVTLPTAYIPSEIYIDVGVTESSADATFTVTVNGQLQQIDGSPVWNASVGGTFVLTAPFNEIGQVEYTNEIVIVFTNNGCTYTNTFFITNPAAGGGNGGVVGDPQFVGLRGQSFQVHGMDGAVYALISDPHTQVNTRFVFLDGPRPCPVLPSTGKPAATCWSHPGSYLGELAVKTSAGDRVHIVAGSAAEGFGAVTVNGKPLAVGRNHALHHLNNNVPAGTVLHNNTHELTLRCSYFALTVENIDGFVNLRSLAVLDGAWPRLQAHGLLGQTWQWKRYSGAVKEIEGEVDDYVVSGADDIWSDSFLFSRFESEAHMQ